MSSKGCADYRGHRFMLLTACLTGCGLLAAGIGPAEFQARAEAHHVDSTAGLVGARAPLGRSRPGCDRIERRRALARERRKVLSRLENVTTLRSAADEARLALRGWVIPPHGYTSLGGMGFTVTNPEFLLGRVEPGKPHLLFYAPSREARTVVDAVGPDFPYRLRGWGYIPAYDYSQHPTGLPCLRRRHWFVHERGVHTLDGGFFAIPPEESVHGTAAGNEPVLPPPDHLGVPHARFWDVHFWLDGDRVPTVSLLNPGKLIPGVDPRVGEWFFYPPPLPDRS